MQEQIKILKEWIDNSNNIVFFGGAGVSTESGIPDFVDIKESALNVDPVALEKGG